MVDNTQTATPTVANGPVAGNLPISPEQLQAVLAAVPAGTTAPVVVVVQQQKPSLWETVKSYCTAKNALIAIGVAAAGGAVYYYVTAEEPEVATPAAS